MICDDYFNGLEKDKGKNIRKIYLIFLA